MLFLRGFYGVMRFICKGTAKTLSGTLKTAKPTLNLHFESRFLPFMLQNT